MKMPSNEEELQICVPPLFKCPISLELMTDPVSLCTGVTYDRPSIEKWFEQGNNTCPATAQLVQTQDLIPNHTLRGLIHKWCFSADSKLHTPEPLAEPATVRQMVQNIDERSSSRIDALRSVKNLANFERNRRCLKSEGALGALIRVLQQFRSEDDGDAAQEAVAAIVAFPVEEVNARKELSRAPAIRTLEWVLVKGNLESRISTASLVESLANADKSAAKEIGSIDGITDGLLSLFQQNLMCPAAVRSGLKALLPLCGVVKNRATIANTEGAVAALIELLPGADRSMAEISLAILEALSTTSEGRCSIVAHALAVPTVVRTLLVVSDNATDYGVRILLAICFNCGEEEMLREIVEMGTFEKLLVVLQMECGQRTKHYANQLLRILSALPENGSSMNAFSSTVYG
ncbi:hypothetical protein SUGI_1106670 [Cryptomeria japonica]|uniref:U-box domain-containing protein 25 n=1 Tax=Cryptomeria japonica TaxID=3369 RepID=UPI002414B83B|nr:U-box domain-containing protein 25 [Cryptomeria japonica]GLJ52039.1 hypothetical protein SUGI_1106670 [Cryptomeria japonica]